VKDFWYHNVAPGRPGQRWFDTKKHFSMASKARLQRIKKAPPELAKATGGATFKPTKELKVGKQYLSPVFLSIP
jgi:hypothetical protein